MKEIKIHNIKITDFAGIDGEVELPVEGQHIIIAGPNEAGKSSIIDAVFTVIDDEFQRVNPIHKGKDKAKVEIVFKDEEGKEYTAIQSITKKGKTLTLKMGDFTLGKPRSNLNKILGNAKSYDPVSFVQLSKTAEGRRSQIKLITESFGLSEKVQEIEDKIVGSKNERVIKHREREDLKKKKQSFKQLESLERKEFENEMNIAELNEQLEQAVKNNSAISEESLKLERIENEIANKGDRIEQLMKEVESLKSEVESLNVIKAESQKFLEENKETDLSEIKVKIASIVTHNKTHRSFLELDELLVKISACDIAYEAENEKIKNLQSDKLNLLANKSKELNLPFEVFLNGDMIYIDKQPIESMNTAKVIQVGIALYMLGQKNLKVLRVDAPSLLDKNGRKALSELIDKFGYQAFVEIVSDDEELEVQLTENLEI